jgi:hypothetical protein
MKTIEIPHVKAEFSRSNSLFLIFKLITHVIFILQLCTIINKYNNVWKKVRCTLSWLEISGKSKWLEYFNIFQNI